MLNKSGLIRSLFFFILFVIGIFLLILLIKYNWDFSEVVEYLLGLVGKE